MINKYGFSVLVMPAGISLAKLMSWDLLAS
jgi:hypothetical protein